MAPETRSDGGRRITVRSQEFDETIVGEATSLRQTVHSFSDFDVNVAVVDKFGQIVLKHD